MNIVTEKMEMSTESKNQVERDKTLVIEDETGRRTSFFPFLSQRKFSCVFDLYKRPFPNSEGLNPGKISGMKSPALLPLEEESVSRGYFSWHMEIEKIRKVNSAKKMLRDLGRHYERIFKQNEYNLDESISEKQIFLNSNLLYLIAATDGNEDTLGHSQLVASYTLMLTKALGIEDKNYLASIERGALLHDIGKIGIPEFILRKAGPLTAVEREVVKEHPLIGYEMIEEFDFIKKAAQIVLFHHESYDGRGYPYELAGEEIPLEARIFAIADTLDAITSDRPYREAGSFDTACLEIEKGSASQFDPLVVDAFFSIPKEKWQQIKEQTEESFRFYTAH